MPIISPRPVKSDMLAQDFGWFNRPSPSDWPQFIPAPPEVPHDMTPTHKEDKKKKARWDLVSFLAMDLEADIMAFGVGKHEDNGEQKWREETVDQHFASLMRHISAYRRGEYLDPETGKPHLAHARCRLGFLLEIEESNRSK